MATPIPTNRAPLSLGQLLGCTGGRLRGPLHDAATQIVGVSSDTRSVTSGQAFVALRGERFDGHEHLLAAKERGAVIAVVDRDVEPVEGFTLLRVEDSLTALGAIAQEHLRRWRQGGGQVVAITGSAGKTTTKLAVAALLETLGTTLAAPGNLNNRIGVPMTALTLTNERYAVLELGTNAPGEIAQLARIVEPEIGVLTLVAQAHSEGLGGEDAIAQEKGALFRFVTGHAIGNADDSRVLALLQNAARYISYGRSEGADVRIVERRLVNLETSSVTLERQGDSLDVELPLVGASGALACAAAVAAASALGGGALTGAQISRALQGLRSDGRMAPCRFGDLVVVDDSYNANPASCRASIDSAREMAMHLGRPLVLVLGEMRELGDDSEAAHDELGDVVAASGARLVIAVAGAAERTAQRAARAIDRVHFCADSADAARLALEQIRPDDLVLVKGSRGIRTERVVEALAGRHAGARGHSVPRLEVPL